MYFGWDAICFNGLYFGQWVPHPISTYLGRGPRYPYVRMMKIPLQQVSVGLSPVPSDFFLSYL